MSGSSTHQTLPSTVSVPCFLISARTRYRISRRRDSVSLTARAKQLKGTGSARAALEGRGRVGSDLHGVAERYHVRPPRPSAEGRSGHDAWARACRAGACARLRRRRQDVADPATIRSCPGSRSRPRTQHHIPPEQSMTSDNKTRGSATAHRRPLDPEERFQRRVTLAFIALTVAIVAVVVIGVGYGYLGPASQARRLGRTGPASPRTSGPTGHAWRGSGWSDRTGGSRRPSPRAP